MKSNRRKIAITILSAWLGIAGLFVACNLPAWVTSAENIAKIMVPIAGNLVTVISPSLAPGVTVVENAFSALIAALDTYKQAKTATNLQAVQAAFDAVNTNVAALTSAAQVKNPKSDAKVKAVVGLLAQAVTEIAALVPPPTAAKLGVQAHTAIVGKAQGLTAKDFKQQYDQIVKGDPRFRPL